ncbi:MAG: DUF4254 domain-containing protein [Pirellulaceae bacterium]|nr:DUF4254 domain-containing protein [Pirellulaceae bacterium]
MLIFVRQIADLQTQLVARWHEESIAHTSIGFLQLVSQEHAYNYLLWHEEDVARSREVGEARIAQAKRAIDGYNQKRNDMIEQLDDAITQQLVERKVETTEKASLNTETPGSVIDRLSILSLRIYHLEEQTQRPDASVEHIESVEHKLALALVQQDELSVSLAQLLEDIYAGRKRHRTYRQMKMYNDPALNPYLYKARQRRAG